MDGELEFAELYKKIIDANFAPRAERSETALRAVLRGLSNRDPSDTPDEAAELPPGPRGGLRTEQTGKESDRCKI